MYVVARYVCYLILSSNAENGENGTRVYQCWYRKYYVDCLHSVFPCFECHTALLQESLS